MKALLLLADEFSEIDAFTVIDILKRANADITTVSVSSSIVNGMSRTKVVADRKLNEIDPYLYDLLILPGGPGYKNLLNSGKVIEIIKNFDKKKKYIAAMCESPIVLAEAGIMDDKIATIQPGFESKLPRPRDARVVVARNVITARTSAAAMDFALKLAEIMTSPKIADKIRKNLLVT
jgi:4-methyl-5(b-hydroxyethyl)-thiazole monophosphate biosynthesis